MTLTTAERLIVLAHHPEKPRFVVPEQLRNVGIIGSILIDLSAEERLKIEGGKIIVKHTNTNLPEPHRLMLQKIHQSGKKRKVKSWISRTVQAPRKYRRGILKSLERKGIIRMEEKRFLFFKYFVTYLIKTSLREQMIQEIRGVIFENKQPDKEISMILGMLQACKMHKIFCEDKEEIKRCKSVLKDMLASYTISRDVDKVIQEMHAAVVSAVIASSVATTASTH
jgi:hypothetical protein